MKIVYPPVTIRDVAKVFWQAIKPRWLLLSVAVLSIIIGSVAGVITPIYYKKFFDLLVTPGDRANLASQLYYTIFVILAFNGLIWLSWRIQTFTYNYTQSRSLAHLKQLAFAKLIQHSHSFFINNFTGALVQRVNRFASAFDRLCDRVASDILPLLVKIVVVTIVAWTIYPLFAYLIFFWVVVFLSFNYGFARWKLKYDLQRAAIDSAATAVLSDTITNHNTIELFNGQTRENNNLRAVTDDQAKIVGFTWNLEGLMIAIQVALFFILEFAVFYFAIGYWISGVVTVGTFVLLQIYALDLGDKVFSFSRIIRDLYQSYADAKEMVEIMKLPPAIQNAPGAQPLRVTSGEIVLQNVSFGFTDQHPVLRDINVTLRAGEKVALIGPSGAGKSTLIKLLLRYHDLSQGAILIDGQNIKTVTKDSLYEAISLVPQDPVLFHRSLRENIRYGRADATDVEVEQAAKLAHCDEFIRATADGYDTYVGERGIKLSGGERQRVAIARAILKNAPILVLDEATSSLDSHSEALIQEALQNLMRGRTTIVIAHRLSTIRKMDRILVIENGAIIEEGSHADLTAKQGLYHHLWELQAGGFLA